MKKLILIKGKENSGKTTTAGLVYKKLLEICDKNHIYKGMTVQTNSIEYNEKNAICDFYAILYYENLTILIYTPTDCLNDLKNFIKKINLDEIDIMISCMRTYNRRNSSYRWFFENYQDNISLVIETLYSENYDERNEIKNEIVNKIINHISTNK